MTHETAILLLIAGVILGSTAGYVLAFRKSRDVQARADAAGRVESELRSQFQRIEAELSSTREKLSASEQARVVAETNAARLPALDAAAQKLQSDLGVESTRAAKAEADATAAARRLEEQRQQHEKALIDLRAAHEKAVADLRDAFKALSADALQKAQPELLRLANESFAKFQETAKGDLTQRQQAIATLLKPIEEQLKIYQERLAQSETTQSSALGEVKKHLESLTQTNQTLSSETLQLRRVLSSNQARGRWGEETLRRVVEAAGMSAHCDFSEQTQSGDAKPDLIVKLPGDRVIIVDAKVPDLDFLNAMDAADETKRAEALAQHAAKLKATIKALADRDYPAQFSNSLDYVVLFLPAESLFSAALEGDRDLIVWAAGKRIIVATPASLIAILRSVSMSWQQHAQTENARAIADEANELFSRVRKFTQHLGNIRAGLERATSAFNDAIGSYDRQVRPCGERLLKLSGAAPDVQLPEVAPVESVLRALPETKTG
jgi:DNA recombination protein RmuC